MEKSLFNYFAKYVSLNVLGMIGLSCYILADTYFVAQALGATGLAALNISIPIFSFTSGIGLMLGIGGATRFSILISRNQMHQADEVLATSVKLGLIIGLLFVLVGIFGSKPLAMLFGADQSTLPLAQVYLRTILVFAPFFMLNNIITTFVRNDQNPNLSMIAMLVGSFSNIFLDYVFMFPLGMGIFGAAFATCLAPIISLLILQVHYWKKFAGFKFLGNKIRWSIVGDLCSLGVSALVNELSSGIVLIAYNLIILGIAGNIGVAAYGIVANLALLVIAIFTGVAQGIQPLTSKYYGLTEYQTGRKIFQYALWTALLLAGLIYLVVFLYSAEIISIFNSENNRLIGEIAGIGLRIYFLGFFFAGINIVAAIYLSTIEEARAAFVLSIARGVAILLPFVYVLSKLWQMTGVWLAFVITELLVTLIAYYLIRVSHRQLCFQKVSPLRKQ